MDARFAAGRIALALAIMLGVAGPRAAWAAADDADQGESRRGRELGVVPLVGGDTDVGFGVGEISTWAAVAPGVKPYVWAVESAAFISFAPGSGGRGGIVNPYQDYWLQLTLPQLAHGRLRLEVRPSFTKETTQRFYGLGNAAPAPDRDMPDRDFYGRIHPTLWVRARYRVLDAFYGEIGSSYTYNRLDVPPESTLAMQMRAGTATVRQLLGETGTHGVLLNEIAILYDTRDNELAPERGQYHQLKVRVSPALGDHFPYAYQQVDAILRGYRTLLRERLVAAGRIVFDVQTGDPPFYELARYEDTFALGGLNGTRGVPGQRYYGKVKLLSNWELRAQLLSFRWWGKDLQLGTALFFDAGRLWSEVGSHPELDGRGLGLKYGAGGGLRLRQGKTFVVRADLAWSPDARPVGGYVGGGHMF